MKQKHLLNNFRKTITKYKKALEEYNKIRDNITPKKSDDEKNNTSCDVLYEDEVNKRSEVSCSRLRKYKQPKRQAYKVNKKDGQYGGLYINYPKMIDEHVVEACKHGSVVYENRCDKSLIDLLTKRFNPKKRYSAKAIQIFNDLNMLSSIPKHKSSGKAKLSGGLMYYTNCDDLLNRLKLLVGTRRAGNNNIPL